MDYFSDEIVGKVLLDKKSPFLQSVIVNKGSKDKVTIGMAVLDGDYLFFRFVTATRHPTHPKIS